MNHKTIALLLLSSSLTLGGCFFHGGTQEHINRPTLGQELTDLKAALDEGAVSQQEYQKKKEKLISDREAREFNGQTHYRIKAEH